MSLTENELTLDLWESVEIVVVLGVDPKVITEWWPDRFRDLNLGIFVVGSLTHFIFSGLVFAMNLKVFNLGLLRPSFTPQDVCLSVQVLCKHCADYEI